MTLATASKLSCRRETDQIFSSANHGLLGATPGFVAILASCNVVGKLRRS